MQSVKVNLRKANGTVWKTVTLGKGGYLKLPSVSNATGYTFMGWSKTRRTGSSTDPDYEAGELLRINKNTNLYATVFNRALEKDISSDEMAHPAIGMMYSKVIFVGDSRTAGIQATLKKTDEQFCNKWGFFCCKPRKGLELVPRYRICTAYRRDRQNRRLPNRSPLSLIWVSMTWEMQAIMSAI